MSGSEKEADVDHAFAVSLNEQDIVKGSPLHDVDKLLTGEHAPHDYSPTHKHSTRYADWYSRNFKVNSETSSEVGDTPATGRVKTMSLRGGKVLKYSISEYDNNDDEGSQMGDDRHERHERQQRQRPDKQERLEKESREASPVQQQQAAPRRQSMGGNRSTSSSNNRPSTDLSPWLLSTAVLIFASAAGTRIFLSCLPSSTCGSCLVCSNYV
jgi:hypothetical protein